VTIADVGRRVGALGVVIAGVLALSPVAGGATWKLQPSPVPTGAKAAPLVGISCASTSSCVAVGGWSRNPDRTGERTLVESWNGTDWSIVPSPNPADSDFAQLSSVSCSSPSACMAVGFYTDGATGARTALAERWNGTHWAITHVPDATLDFPQSVSCRAANWCTATGYLNPDYPTVLVEHWDGHIWMQEDAPTPLNAPEPDGSRPPAQSGLQSISCPSETDCEAVGWSKPDTNPDGIALAERWNGRRWLIQSISTGPLSGLSCAHPDACTAVGVWEPGDYSDPFVVRWDGTSWSGQADAPIKLDSTTLQGGYTGVSCHTATDCTAVGGTWGTVTGGEIAEGWDGTSWTEETVAGTIGLLNAVSCPTSVRCFAVGYAGTNNPGIESYSALAPSEYFLRIDPNDLNGSGNVTSSPAGINCGSKGTRCMARFPEGTQVTLSEVADPGSTFVGWGIGFFGGNPSCDDAPTSCTFPVPLDQPIAVTEARPSFKTST
jgi:hypothetical protein